MAILRKGDKVILLEERVVIPLKGDKVIPQEEKVAILPKADKVILLKERVVIPLKGDKVIPQEERVAILRKGDKVTLLEERAVIPLKGDKAAVILLVNKEPILLDVKADTIPKAVDKVTLPVNKAVTPQEKKVAIPNNKREIKATHLVKKANQVTDPEERLLLEDPLVQEAMLPVHDLPILPVQDPSNPDNQPVAIQIQDVPLHPEDLCSPKSQKETENLELLQKSLVKLLKKNL